MAVRTFFWDPAAGPRRKLFRKRTFKVGNAGDLLNRDIVAHFYGAEAANVKDEGRRLLLVGSVAHRILDGDLVYGVGTKGVPIPSATEVGHVEIRGVRGPVTYDAFAAAGFDMSAVGFQYDPGLLVKELYPVEAAARAVQNRVTFIPHYRDRDDYRSVRGARVVDIDCEPRVLAREVAEAELVLTSSLHGLVFAHAIGRPAVFIAPLRAEPLIKYQDYVASVGLDWVEPVTLDEAQSGAKPASPASISFDRPSLVFPTREELIRHRIASS